MHMLDRIELGPDVFELSLSDKWAPHANDFRIEEKPKVLGVGSAFDQEAS
jgi:hypothetical protein